MILNKEQEQRYARHFVLKEIGKEGQKKLLKSKVLIIGLGGLGSVSSIYLSAAGIGTLGLVDFDIVELPNLQRQIIHKTSDVGMKKIISAQNTIKDINPEVNTVLYDTKVTKANIEDIINDYDFIVEATDKIDSKILINDACVINKKPFSHAGVIRFQGQALTYIPGEGPCLRCFLEKIPEYSPTCKEVGVLGAVVGILGNIQAIETIKYLLGIDSLLSGRVLQIDTLSMNFHTINFKHSSKDCPVCSRKNLKLSDLYD